jgi:hypothetical protein
MAAMLDASGHLCWHVAAVCMRAVLHVIWGAVASYFRECRPFNITMPQ